MGLSINTVGAFERLPFVWRGQIKQIGPIEPLLQVQCKPIPLPEGLQLVPFDTIEESEFLYDIAPHHTPRKLINAVG